MSSTPTTADRLPALRALVVKDRVGLGGLPAAQRSLALALAWAGLPAGATLSEREINDGLRAQLAGAAIFLETRHRARREARRREWQVGQEPSA